MEESIKLKDTEESFIDYLRKKDLLNVKKFEIEKKDLLKFFEIKSDKESISVSLLFFQGFYKCRILSESFFFFPNPKKITLKESNGKTRELNFQTLSDEDDYLDDIKNSKDLYDIYKETENGKFESINISKESNNSLISDKKYYIVEKKKTLKEIIKFTPFYEDYIYISNQEVYQEFEFKKSPSRDKFFNDLNKFFLRSENRFFPICGHSGSGKTTSILYCISELRNIFNIFYINCFTILREDLDNKTIKEILSYELKNSVKEDENIAKMFLNYLENSFKNKIEINTTFLWKLINDIIDIYINEGINSKLSVIIDQYSAKYDQNNKNIYGLISKLKVHKNFKILLISSMNNTCVNNNLKKTVENSICPAIDDKYIKYSIYGQLFEISDVISKENNELKNLISQEFGNSGLIYYNLKSKLLECDKNLDNIVITNFIFSEKNHVKKEIESFYNIIYSNNENDKKFQKNDVYKILNVLDIIKKKTFYNYIDIPRLLEQLPMKYFKILYNEIDISHPEFIKLLPKKIREEINRLEIFNDYQKQNMECPLKNTLENNLKDLNDFLIKFDGNQKKTISFFTFEPLYQILELILKELIYYNYFQDKLIQEIYSELTGGNKGDFFEYILINFIMDEKKFLDFNLDIIENINSLVPYSFSIDKFSHRLLLLKKNKNANTGKKIDKKNEMNVKELDEEENQVDDNNEKENDIQEKSENKQSKEKQINYKKKYYSKSKDKEIFEKLKIYINQTFNITQLKTEKNLPNKNIYLNQMNSNAKYVDGGLLIYLNEKNQKFNFKLIVFQVSIKRDENKIFNKNETSLILAYIKENLENCYPNINIEEIVFYYIIDSEKQDPIIKTNCDNYSIGCYGFNIKKKKIIKVNELTFHLKKFSKFNSCFILKSDTNVNKKIIELIDKEEPTLFENINKDILSKYFEPFFYKDISISNDFYIFNDLKIDFGISKHLTNYALLVSINENEKTVEYIVLNEKKVLDYSSDEIKSIKDIKKDASKLRLITFLIPMKLKKINK